MLFSNLIRSSAKESLEEFLGNNRYRRSNFIQTLREKVEESRENILMGEVKGVLKSAKYPPLPVSRKSVRFADELPVRNVKVPKESPLINGRDYDNTLLRSVRRIDDSQRDQLNVLESWLRKNVKFSKLPEPFSTRKHAILSDNYVKNVHVKRGIVLSRVYVAKPATSDESIKTFKQKCPACPGFPSVLHEIRPKTASTTRTIGRTSQKRIAFDKRLLTDSSSSDESDVLKKKISSRFLKHDRLKK